MEAEPPTENVIETTPAVPEAPPVGGPPQLDPPENHRWVERLRSLAGRKTSYQGPIIGITQGWMSRDSSFHIFAARYFDYAMLTDEHLVCFSTGFLSRRPRRRVFREPLNALVVIPRGDEPFRTMRIVGDFNRPLLFEVRSDDNSIAFARELVARSREAVRLPANLLSTKKPKRSRKSRAINAPDADSVEATGEQTPTQ